MRTSLCVAVVEQYIDAYNHFDVESMLALMHEGVRFCHMSGQQVGAEADGIEAFRELAEQARDMFESRHQKILRWTIDEVTLVLDLEYEGVLRHDMPHGHKAGSHIKFSGQSEFCIQDGKIWRLTDRS
ncbi:nuclear transport factor 2 family protein [Chitinivorax sp. PXF-14]|uniref:nuclear transport factor 2 family protein n=1 Tax=Chitinivorax sp. PXF-14 TaxID=3230488 RepID=UPI003466E9EB